MARAPVRDRIRCGALVSLLWPSIPDGASRVSAPRILAREMTSVHRLPGAVLLARWWPPLLAWLTATTVMIVTCVVGGWPPFDAQKTWSRWDSGLYLAIAQHGYSLFICPPGTPPGWRGDACWFPGYPWVTGGVAKLGIRAPRTGCAGDLLARLPGHARARLAGVAGAHIPLGGGDCRSCTPHSLPASSTATPFTRSRCSPLPPSRFSRYCNAIAGWRRGSRRRWGSSPIRWASRPRRPTLWLLAHRSVPLLERLRRIAFMAYPSLVALWILVFDQWLETGRWNAYLLIHRKYGHHLQDPFHTVGSGLAHSRPRHGSFFTMAKSPALETLLVSFVLACVLIELVVRRGPSARADALVAIWAVLAWAVPLAETKISTYRTEAALLPLALLVRRLPRPLGAVIAIAAAVLAVPMTKLYLRDYLV